MSISHKELMALRRAQQQQLNARGISNISNSESEHAAPRFASPQPPTNGSPSRRAITPSTTVPATTTTSSSQGPSVSGVRSLLGAQRSKEADNNRTGQLGLSNYHAQRFFKSVAPTSMEPKVFSAHERVVGEIPREEALRRKRNQFDQSTLDVLLSECGVDYYRDGVSGVVDETAGVPDKAGAASVAIRFPSYHRLLPLEAFDDYSFDDFSPQDWMAKGVDADSGKQLGVPCLAVQIDMNQRGKWVPGRVLEWSEEDHRLLVFFEESGEQAWKPRIDVFFFAEDPVKFATRVASAHNRRREAESKLRFNLCVESMPVDESQVMSRDMVDRVRVLAVSDSKLLRLEDRLDLPGSLREINTDYGRAMNRQLFERSSHSDPVVSSMLAFAKQPSGGKLSQAAPGPARGKIQIPGNDHPGTFAAILSSFHQTSYFNQQDEVVLALQRVRAECDSVIANTELFQVTPALDSMRPLTPRDFDDTQTVSMNTGMQNLREAWRSRLRAVIQNTLHTATETDPVNLTMHRKDQYLGTKTQKFMTTVKLAMQDSLHHLLTSSLEKFTRFVEENVNWHVDVHNLSTIKNIGASNVGLHPESGGAAGLPIRLRPLVYGNDLRKIDDFAPRPTPPPLFRVSLVDKEHEGLITYDFGEADILKIVLDIFARLISMGQEIPALEGFVFDFIYSSPPATIAAINAVHPIVQQLRERIIEAITHATTPMREYVKLYDPFLDIVKLTVQELEDNFNHNPRRLAEMEHEMKKFQARRETVEKTIPQSVQLGGIRVDCGDLRKKLADKCTAFITKIKELIAQSGRKKAEDIDDKFGKIRSALIRDIETPEDCVAIRNVIAGIPEQVYDLNLLINEMKEVFDTLDKHCVILGEDDFAKKWRAIGWPARLEEDVVRTQARLESRKNDLVAELDRKQQTLDAEIQKLQRTVANFWRRNDLKKVSETAAEVKSILADIQRAKDDATKYATHEALFEIPVDDRKDYGSLVATVNKEFDPYATLWITADDWLRWEQNWQTDEFEKIDAEEMERNVHQAGKNMQRVLREPRFKDKTPILKIADEIKNQIDEFKPIVPAVKYLRTAGMRDRHWNEISQELGFEVRPGTTLMQLPDVNALDLPVHEEVLHKISEIAAREYQIESSLSRMKSEWNTVPFNLKPYKKTGCFVMGKDSMDKIQEVLDDQMLTTQALTFSPFKKQFEKEIETWDATIKLIQAVVDNWKNCQKVWMYLEPIFQSDDILRQLPQEAKRFGQVHKHFKYLSNRANDLLYCLAFCQQTEDCLTKFEESNELLEKVQKGLNQYLENKRSSFARFYFLSDDEVLTILSQAKDPRNIQPHFRKVFENIFEIDMRNADCEMFGWWSGMREYVKFREPIIPRKNVENWLADIETMMKRSIRHELQEGMTNSHKVSKRDFVLSVCGQVGIAVNQMGWTAACERCLVEHGSLEPYVPEANAELMLLVETVRGELTSLQQMNLSGMITIEVHARDIVETLAKAKVSTIDDFDWISQLRSYWVDGNDELRQIEARFTYGCEPLGNTSRLVVTPLTDRIYLTLTGAMSMYMGAAPAGPAGTGKTETTKDLAKALAKQCVVFNCQEGMTYQSMGKFFKGLGSSGAWACFDEFNRINVEVLSVVAQQVGDLQEALRTKQFRINFEGTEIVVDPTHAVFITMNPGYAGRTELPDNLKVLFRPVACMVPDYAMIAEIRLFSFGYTNARKLAQKMVATFRLSSEQLSSQDHYDFGMRAVNTVISAAGLMKRQYPDDDEDILLLRALRDSNSPKFLEEDLKLFNGIISDLFPKVVVPAADYGLFKEELQRQALKMHLEPTEMFIQKCVQLYEMTVLRHGQMSVGPTMGGKSCATRVLQSTMGVLGDVLETETDPRKIAAAKRFAEVRIYALNPKSVTLSQLYGGFDEGTGEWRDGLIGELFRIAASDNTRAKKWVLFDGPVDAVWIESMNTVLDENKKLCLISGEIISMSTTMNCWFEVEDLAVASPATVSRAGMIYLEPTTCIGVESFVRCWVDFRLPKTLDSIKESLKRTCNNLFQPLLAFVASASCVEYQPTVWPNLLKSCFNIFNGYLEPYTPTRTYDPPQEKIDFFIDAHLQLLIYSIVWSVGATGDNSSRKKFDRTLRDEIKRQGVPVSIPDVGLLHDYEYVLDDKRWVPWLDRASSNLNVTVSAHNFAEIIVPTIDVIRYKTLIRHLLVNDNHVLAVGPTGTGKSLVIQELLMKGMPSEYSPIFFTFSARTSANQTQDLIFSKFEARRRASPQIWGAPVNKKFVVLLDDMNMPLREVYGAQPPVELMRQFADYKGWYDRKAREFYNVVDVLMIGAMGPPGGGRNKVSNRFLRHFNHIAFPEIEEENMKKIFMTILDAFIVGNGFNEDVRSKVQTVVESSIEVYKTVCTTLLPRPSKPHYLFNMRDLAKVVSGLLNAEPKHCPSGAHFLRLWIHEQSRTFRDRLVDDADRSWFDETLRRQLQTRFKLRWADVVAGDKVLFADFMRKGQDLRSYEEVPDPMQLCAICDEYLEDYNKASLTHKMHLVLFLDATEHVTRVARVLAKPAGHALLLGVGGSGRQSAAKLASFISEYDIKQVEVSRGYGMPQWREDVKAILRHAGFRTNNTTFIMTDTQCVNEGMLEDVNNLLNAGEVPNLFVGQELDELNLAMKPICVNENIPVDKVNLYARFVKACKAHLHVVVCMSPIGEVFRNRLRMFPALVNCCTIDWFTLWPEQALISVAQDVISKLEAGIVEEHRVDDCVQMFVYMHQTVEKMAKTFLDDTKRQTYVTPTSYLELLHTFKVLMKKSSSELNAHRSRLVRGLDTLRETEGQISELQKQLERDQPLLIQRKQEIAQMVDEIATETAAAEQTRLEAVEDERKAAVKTAECTKIFQKSDEMLKEAQPMLDAALESLKMLKPSDFVEVNSYRSHTPGVLLTLEGLLQLFGVKPVMKVVNPAYPEKKEPDWVTPSKEYLGKAAQLMDKLINFDKENIPERIIKQIGPLVKNEDFTPDKIRNASRACAALCSWVHSMYKYHFVLKEVQPLRDALAVAKAELDEVQAKLDAARSKLQQVEERLAYLNKNKEEAEAEMSHLEKTVQQTEIKLVRAGMLIDGLAGEKKSWNNTIAQLNDKEQYLFGDTLVAAGQVSYSGPYTSKYRIDLIEQWKYKLNELSILHSPQLSLYHTLQDALETRQWNLAGLPSDQLSVENGLIVKYSRRYPLMIDPQTQANKWIRRTYGEPLEIVRPGNKDMIKRIEHGIRNGRPVLLENVGDEVDPALDPLLQQQVFVSGGQRMIRISDNPIPWNDNFRFFMTTKLPNPAYIPEVQVKVALLNFFITPLGLEDQLLGVIVGCEKKELEMQKNALVQQSAAMRQEIANIQSTILKSLDEVTGDILDDEELIKYLDQSKIKTREIAEKVVESEQTEKEIDETRERYRPVAKHGSLLYFCCADLPACDPMYQYSLQWFVQLFETSIEQAEQADELDERLRNLENFFTYAFYNNVSRSLFEKHKLMFSFVLAIRIIRGRGELNQKEWTVLIQGPVATGGGPSGGGKSDELANPAPSWLTDASWKELLCLERDFPSAFKGFGRHFHDNIDHYERLFLSQNAHREALAGAFSEKLTRVQKMLFLRALRPDKVLPAVQDFVTDTIGERFVSNVPFDLASSFKDSSPTVPLVFILSPGADPKAEFAAFAESQRMNRRLAEISLGQGQGERATRFIKEGVESGMWVFLQNAHLATSWMPDLERLVESIQGNAATVNPVFRLWITSMPNDHFPVTILQNAVKMTVEPPKGIRANIARSLTSFGDAALERCKQSKKFKKLTFAFCFFHALIQERRKFGPLGWNIAYEYAPGDLLCCVNQLRMFLDKYDEVPFRVIKELSGNIHYGGRVTDDWDRRTLNTLLAPLICPDTLHEGYKFSPSGIYNTIAPTDVAGYLNVVNNWPLNTGPEAFGLHDNADITCARAETFETLGTIVRFESASGVVSAATSSGSSGGSSSSSGSVGSPGTGGTSLSASIIKTPDEQVTELCQQILARVRQPFDEKAFHGKYPTMYEESMNTVLVQESIRFNKLIRVVRSTLSNLISAIKGLVVMSKDLEVVYKALLTNQVPAVWSDVAYPSMKPLGAWVTDLAQRLQMIETWYETGHPRAYWISGFFFPQAFLTGTLQNFARSKQISIDTISYSFEWTNQAPESLKAPPAHGCYIYGMFIEGARVNGDTFKLEESRPKVLFESTPMVWLVPTINREKPAHGIYDCPLYKTVRRAGTLSTTGHSTNYVLTLEANTDVNEAHWVKRGVAMVCTLSY